MQIEPVLVANGCSFTWGDELEGFDQNPHTHQELRWSNILSKKLGVEERNIAACGNGNDKIFRDTCDYLQGTNTLPEYMVIMWSGFGRFEFIENRLGKGNKYLNIERKYCMTQLSAERWDTARPDKIKYWKDFFYKLYTIETGIIHSLTYMNHMQWLCNVLGVKLIQCQFHKRNYEALITSIHPELVDYKHMGDYCEYVKHKLGSLEDRCRIGLGRKTDMYAMAINDKDCRLLQYGHPCEVTHKKYAELIYDVMKSENFVNG